MGAPAELMAELTQPLVVDILPQNWTTVLWFNQVADLLRYRHDGVCLGLDLVQVQAECQLSQRQITPEQFQGLRLMSKTVAEIINQG